MLTPIQKRLFIGTAIAIFFAVMIHQLGIQVGNFISPVPARIDAMDSIRPKLQEKKNSFSVRKETRFIPQASADTYHDYDDSSAYIVMDFATGEVLLEKNISEKRSIASITKVMTSIVVLDLVNPSVMFKVTDTAAAIEPTKIGVVPGQYLTVRELLEASLLTSANDAVEVLREGVDKIYSEDVFIQAMNQKAEYIGLKNTSFDNPQGFDGANHFSTVEDLAVLSRYALTEYPVIASIVKKDYEFLPESAYHKQYDLYNWNGLLGVYPNVTGVKIGNTDDAGRTTSVVAERNGKKILVVLLGAPGILERDLWTASLLDYGFAKKFGFEPISVTEEQLMEKYATWQ